MTVAEARSAALGTRAVISGVVTYPSGLYARNIYLQDATGGLRIYLAEGEFPLLPLGERVDATGRLRDYHGELELYLSRPEDAIDLGAGAGLMPVRATTDSVSEPIEGRLVRVAGRVVDYASSGIVLDDGSGPLTVHFPDGSPFRRPSVQRGEFWSTVGVVGQYFRARPYEGGYRLLPRTEADISLPPAFLPVTGGADLGAATISGQ